MKANEFRVGNWLLYVWENEVGLPVKEYMRIEPIDIWRMEDDEFMELFEPIPLTPEILEKCGFSDNDYKTGYIGINIKAGGITTEFVLTKPKLLGEFQNHFCWEFRAGNIPFFLELEFLHQLQNLYFALTGEELNINLEE